MFISIGLRIPCRFFKCISCNRYGSDTEIQVICHILVIIHIPVLEFGYVYKRYSMYLSHQVCVLMRWLFFPCSSSHITELSNNIATNTDGIILRWITPKKDLAYWSMTKLNWRREKGRLSTMLIARAGTKGNVYIALWIGTLLVEEKHALV